MLKKVASVQLFSPEEQQEKILSALHTARSFDFQQKNLDDITDLHGLLCEVVLLCETSSWNNWFTLTELKSRRLACVCKIESLKASPQT